MAHLHGRGTVRGHGRRDPQSGAAESRPQGVNMLHVEVNRIAADPLRMDDAVRYLSREVRPVVERRPGSLGTALLVAQESGAMGFESFWASSDALADSGDVIAAGVREAARRAGGTVA